MPGTFIEATIIDAFRQAMAEYGIVTDAEIVADGGRHRFHVDGDKRGSRNGWYILHVDGKPAGAFGSWRLGVSAKWSDSRAVRLTREQRRALMAEVAAKRAAREAADRESQAAARVVAEGIWKAAHEASDDHPYLRGKGVKAHGVRVGRWERFDPATGAIQVVSEDALLVALKDAKRQIHSLQAILPAKLLDGRDKDFLPRGSKEGHFHDIGEVQTRDGKRVFILGEGYATCASVHEATEHMVLVCFDAGNLGKVAAVLRQRQPEAIILFAADNDLGREDGVNVGVLAAVAAAKAVGGLVAVPVLAAAPTKKCDFNDLHQAEGLEVVAGVIEAALAGPVLEAKQPAAQGGDAAAFVEVQPASAAAGEATSCGGEEAVITLEEAERSPGTPPMFSPAEMLPSQLPKSADARDGSLRYFALTEKGNSYRLANVYGQNIRFVTDLNEFLAWADGRWVPDRGDRILRAAVGRLPKAIRAEAAFHATEGMPEDAGHALKWAQKSDSAAVIGNTVTLLKDVPQLQIQFRSIDADPMLAGFDGGRQVVDLRTGAIRQALRGDLVTRTLGVSALGDASKAMRWQSFLLEVFSGDHELIDWFWRFVGYCLSGLYTEQIFLFLHGSGANGKSVLLKVLGALFGGYGAVVHAGTLMEQQRTGKEASPDVLGMAGARLLLGSEVAQGEAFDERFLKSWTGGDLQKARPLHGKIVDFEPVGKLMIAGNHRPRIVGTDPAVWRRVRLVPFRRHFAEHERDPALVERLMEELVHTAAWAVDGCREWQQRGLADTPQSVRVASADYAVEQDTLGEFLTEKTDPGGECASADLFKVYLTWAHDCNIRPMSRQAFGRQVRERGYSVRHTRDGKVVEGVCLRAVLSGPPR